MVRLSYVDMVKSELPEALHGHLTSEAEAILRFAEIEESVDNTDCQLIIDRINSRAPNQAMKALLTSKEICSSGDFLYQIFCECIFFQGAKSMLHITTYLERYYDTIITIKGQIILESLANVWKNSAQRISLLSQKLLQLKLVSHREVAEFCVQRINRADSYKDQNSLEWTLINICSEDNHKFEVMEIVCQNVKNSDKRMLDFLRKNVKDLEENQVREIESIIKDRTSVEISSLRILV